jgi:hypothetical protein
VYEEVGEVMKLVYTTWQMTSCLVIRGHTGGLEKNVPAWLDEALSLVYKRKESGSEFAMPDYLLTKPTLLALLRESVTAGGPTPGLEAYLTMMRLGGR